MSEPVTERTPIFEESTKNYDWPKLLLSAINTARRMGIENFEISVGGQQHESRPNFVRVGGMFDVDPQYKEVGTIDTTHQRITVYAVTLAGV